jgi:hypothetical protein
MPLLDHFHPPLSDRRHWEAFHARWASAIADELNAHLPDDYFAEAQVHHGARVEIDVATFSERNSNGGGTAVQTIAAPTLAPADLLIPAVFLEQFAVHIFQNAGGPSLVAAIELASPANKDRAETRRAFAVKCAAYLQRGIGLIVVDVVTNRHANLLRDLLELMNALELSGIDVQALMAVSYRPVQVGERGTVEARLFPLAIGQTLPTVPLALDAGQILLVDFEATYTEARERSRL